jgi:hypothetical protein
MAAFLKVCERGFNPTLEDKSTINESTRDKLTETTVFAPDLLNAASIAPLFLPVDIQGDKTVPALWLRGLTVIKPGALAIRPLRGFSKLSNTL